MQKQPLKPDICVQLYRPSWAKYVQRAEHLMARTILAIARAITHSAHCCSAPSVDYPPYFTCLCTPNGPGLFLEKRVFHPLLTHFLPQKRQFQCILAFLAGQNGPPVAQNGLNNFSGTCQQLCGRHQGDVSSKPTPDTNSRPSACLERATQITFVVHCCCVLCVKSEKLVPFCTFWMSCYRCAMPYFGFSRGSQPFLSQVTVGAPGRDLAHAKLFCILNL